MGQLLAIRYALMICITNGGAWFMILPLNWTFSAFECPFLGAKPSPEHGWATLIFIRSTHSSAMFGFMVGACPWIFFSDMPSVLVAKLALLQKKKIPYAVYFLSCWWQRLYCETLGTSWAPYQGEVSWAGRIGDIEVADSSPFGGPVRPLDESTRVNLGADTSYISAVSYNVMNHRCTSGYLTVSHGKSPFLIGKPSINGPSMPWRAVK